ncbi:MAG: helix-turn-helix transcriptional regulator [SAR324 cluster bacterium]|nr:helix-turn-helix transcriptional regulator [SAR324 cluster bacterium]
MKFRDYHEDRMKEDPDFFKGHEQRYEEFKLGVLLKEARMEAGLTQEAVAQKLGTTKSAISRIENHAKDIRFATLERFAEAVGKKLEVAMR